jgi:hypothetical protein
MTDTQLPTLGDTAVCRHCLKPITYEVVKESGYLDRTGWSDGHWRDALVCFRALNYSHAPRLEVQS